MLSPEERAKAVEILVDHYVNKLQSEASNYSPDLKNYLTNGFKGFASYSDSELVRLLNKLGRKGDNWEAQDFVSSLLLDRIILDN